MSKTVLTSFTILCLLSIVVLTGYQTSVKASPHHLIHVPTDFPTIQEAINNATDGDTIFVHKGTYHEHVIVNKSVSLVGEDRHSTIIDGNETGRVISITANNVNVNGFTIQKSGRGLYDSGILVDHSSGNNISHNTIKNNYHGIHLYSSSNNMICCNDVSSNNYHGIYFDYSSNNTVSSNNASSNKKNGIHLHSSSNNMIWDNDVSSNNYQGIHLYSSSNNMIWDNDVSSNNYHGIYLYSSSNNNIICHNNFTNNTHPQVWSNSVNVWDDGVEGNYWSDYNGTDLYRGPYQNKTGSDGIGDVPHVIDENNQDNYPLMGVFSEFEVAWKEETYHVTTVCNSTISNFRFEVGRETGNKIIRFSVTGKEGSVGFCRVATPTDLMNYPCIVLVDEEEIIPTLLDVLDNAHVYLYFTYIHSSHTITMISSKLLYLYNELLNEYAELQIDFYSLNSTYHELLNNQSMLLSSYIQLLESYGTLNLTTHELLSNYSTLLGNYTQLLEKYNSLNTSHQELKSNYSQLLESYNTLNSTTQELLHSYSTLLANYSQLLERYELQANYTSLLSEHEQNIRSLIYVFIATTTIFIIAALYLSTHAHRKASRK